MHRFANPARFQRIARPIVPVAAVVAAILLGIGLYLALIASPPDYQQSETVRIMYVHVPMAWLAMSIYAQMAIAGAAGIIWKHPLAHLFTKAAAPLGAAFTAGCLITGGLWGEPMWGTWWVWDARLTSVLILFFFYLGYLALVSAFDNPDRGLQAGAVLTLVGAVNLPIIKFSVDWWNTLHQPASVSRLGAPAMPAEMLTPLLIMALGMLALYISLVLIRTQTEILRRKAQTLRLARAAAGAAGSGEEAVPVTGAVGSTTG